MRKSNFHHQNKCMVGALLLFWSLTVLFSACREPSQRKLASQTAAVAAEVLIKFKSNAPDDSIRVLTNRVGLQKIREISPLGVHVYRITSPHSVEQVIRECQASPHVEYAEPNLKYRIPEEN
jgi:hypothetical protein